MNINTSNAKSVTLTAQWQSDCNDGLSSVGSYKNFDYTGSVQTFNACAGRTYKLEVWGAQGGQTKNGAGGYGGYSYGNYSANINSTIYVTVGGMGLDGGSEEARAFTGGYNGGGQGYGGGSGGGASHIGTRSGVLSSLSSYKSNVLIVAGAGGGQYGYCTTTGTGGHGGGQIGYSGVGGCSSLGGNGGTQTSGGSSVTSHGQNGGEGLFGQGGGTYYQGTVSTGMGSGYGGGGGGGWFGGSAGGWTAGAGGSGYIGNSLLLGTKRMYQYSTGCTSSTATATYTVCTSSTGHAVANAANTGNGYAKITRQS